MALDDFRGAQDEYTTFFGDVFDQIQNLSLELFARHKCLEASAEQKLEADRTLAGVRDEFQRAIEQLQQLQGHVQSGQQEAGQNWGEIRAAYQRFLDEQAELREGVRQIAGEFAGIKEDVQRERKEVHDLYANVESQLARLSTLTAELVEAQARPAQDPQMAGVLEHTRQQQAEWLQQRAALEAELDAARRRAAEQAEALHEQKRSADLQQAELGGELKRMQSLLEVLAGQIRGEPVVPGQSTKPRVDSAMLGSVLAEFELLQRDVPSRRAKRNGEPPSGGSSFPPS